MCKHGASCKFTLQCTTWHPQRCVQTDQRAVVHFQWRCWSNWVLLKSDGMCSLMPKMPRWFVVHFLWPFKQNIHLVKVRLGHGGICSPAPHWGFPNGRRNPNWLVQPGYLFFSVCKGKEYFHEYTILPCNNHTWTPWDMCTIKYTVETSKRQQPKAGIHG